MSKQFHISDILSIYTGVAVSRYDVPGRTCVMDGIYEILDYMCGESLSTIQLPRVAGEARPYLEQQFPWLKTVKVPDFKKGTNGQDAINAAVIAWVAAMAQQYGEYHDVRPMFEGDHELLSPEEDAKRINPNILTVNLDMTEDEPPSPTGDINWKVEP